MVDVRDVAEMHLRAVTMKPKSGRFITAEGTYEMAFMGKVLHDEFRKYGYKPNKKKLKYCVAKMASCCSKELKPILKQWGKNVKCDNSKSKKELGMEYMDMKQSIIEMAHSLVKHVRYFI